MHVLLILIPLVSYVFSVYLYMYAMYMYKYPSGYGCLWWFITPAQPWLVVFKLGALPQFITLGLAGTT